MTADNSTIMANNEDNLQPTIRQGYQRLGAEMLRGKPQAKYAGCYAHTLPNRYRIFSRLHLSQSGNSVYTGADAFRQ